MYRIYKPNQNGPREYFIESDDDIRMSQSIGAQPILPIMVMAAAQQAFMNSGHQKDKIRAINEEWGLNRSKYATMDGEYQAFKTFYTKNLRTMYSDSYKRYMANHTEEEAWDKVSAMEAKVGELEAQQEYLTAMQTITETPTTISVPSGDLTENSSVETITNAVIAALVKSGAICNNATSQETNRNRNKPNWRKIQYYCYTHGANVSHTSKDCKTPLGDHLAKPNATRCDPQGGSTKNIDKRNYWTHKGKFQKEKPN